MRRTTHPRLSSGSTPSTWLSFLNLPAPLPCWGPQEGCADLLPALGMEKARGQGLPGHSSVESLQISFTRWKLLTIWKSWVSEPTRGEQNAAVAARRMVASDSQESQGLRILLLESTVSPLVSAAGNYWGGDGGGPGLI